MYIEMEAIRTLCLIISCTTLFLCVNGKGNAAPFPKIDAIYQFGDSISDTGNVFFQAGNVGCGMSPYGETFFHRPTGRCSDGLLMVDHIARALRLPLVDPYLARYGNFTHGVNFAVAGATALDISFLAAKKITAVGTPSSLLVQLGWFKSHLSKICTNPSAQRQKLRNALFIVGGIGGDDYNSGGLAGENLQDLRRLVPDVVQAISNVVREVINLGARRIIVPGSFPVGCMPICGAGIRVGDPSYDDLGCLKSWNEFAAFHNSMLQASIINIQRQNPGVRVVYGDYFSALYSLMRNAPALGFDPNGLYTPCCSNCGSPAGVSCPNPSSRVSWDGLHMTQHAYQYVANTLLRQIRKINEAKIPRIPRIPRIEAIYQFGDSISDTGNFVHEAGLIGCARPPYGQTYFHHPTGRCSDGLLMIDNFAWAFKLPFLSPYLDKFGNFSHGVNFAVVGATALDISYLKYRNISAFGTPSSLLVQLGWFKSHLASICVNPSECKQKMGNALFIVGGIGGNDYISGIFGGKTIQDLRSLVPHVVQAITKVIREVIYLGARRIVVPGSFPAGCMPFCLAAFRSNDQAMYDELGCLKIWNDFASFHNFQLQQAIISLQQHYPGVKIIYGDYFSAHRSLLKNGGSLGFDRNGLYEPCCIMCGSDGVTACPNPSSRVSWDGLHLTQHAYQFIADRLLKQIMML